MRSPDLISTLMSQRRGVRGYLAVSRGLIAVGAGDARAARKAAEEALRIAPNEPLALLLNAQNAQLAGNRAEAEHAFRAMAEREDTKLLGLRGLYVEARRRDDMAAAQAYAEEAAKVAPTRGLGKPGGARLPLCRGRLECRAHRARPQQPQRPARQGRLSPPARGAADRAGDGRRGNRQATRLARLRLKR